MGAIMLLDASGQKIEISLSTLNVWNVLQFYDTDHAYAVFTIYMCSLKELLKYLDEMKKKEKVLKSENME